MNWILFLFISTYTGPAMTTQTFSTYQACQKARENLKSELLEFYGKDKFKLICIQKANGEKQ